jgi:purine-binding chemotaxis protein CheW
MSNLALAHAGAPPVLPADGAPAQYLTFTLAGETFAIGILAIKEIIEYRAPTEVPMMPPSVRGVINLRGAIVPVLDLLSRFGQTPSPVGKRTCIVIVEIAINDERQVLGVVVDAVSEVLEIPDTEIEPPPNFGARIRGEFVAGIGKVRGRFVILLAVDRVLSINAAASLAAAAAEAGQAPAA